MPWPEESNRDCFMPAPEPLILQRADPFVRKHTDGYYYFTASVPAYDLIEVRRARTIAGLGQAKPVVVWRKPDRGPLSDLIWAPEIHFVDGAWYIYFAAAPNREIIDGLFQHRIYAITTTGENPLESPWHLAGKMEGVPDSFSLDATTFNHRGQQYFLWAQKDPAISGNSNLYIARMETPTRLSTRPTLLSHPEFDWEVRGFFVNEGPAVLVHGGKIFVTYSASATDENYCVGLLSANESDDLLDAKAWTKAPRPVLTTDRALRLFGPGHSSFTKSEDNRDDILVYHARTYTDIVGDPLWDPNRHTYVSKVKWSEAGLPILSHDSI